MLIGLQKAVINSEPQNAVKSRKKKNQVRNDGYKGSPLFMEIEPRFSIDKLTGSDLSMGPFKEWFFANNDMYDMGRSAASRQSSWYRGGGTDIATHSDLALSLNIYA